MTRYLMARIRRQHNLLWVYLVYMEPMGAPTWCVWTYADGTIEKELARSSSRMIALFRAAFQPTGGGAKT